MALFNFATKEITLKLVYYGPGLSGKTTNLQHLHANLNPEKRGKLLSLSTESDRTLFFDFLPIELGKIRDFSIRFQLYTVPGQVRYNATRKVVLKGADAVVFVADSQRDMRDQNLESFENMMENLTANNINPEEIPILLQFNKRDLKNILSLDELNADLNPENRYPFHEACALDGTGVEECYKLVIMLLLKNVSRKHNIQIAATEESGKTAPVSPMEKQPEMSVPLMKEEPLFEPETVSSEEVSVEPLQDEGESAFDMEIEAESSFNDDVMYEAEQPVDTEEHLGEDFDSDLDGEIPSADEEIPEQIEEESPDYEVQTAEVESEFELPVTAEAFFEEEIMPESEPVTADTSVTSEVETPVATSPADIPETPDTANRHDIMTPVPALSHEAEKKLEEITEFLSGFSDSSASLHVVLGKFQQETVTSLLSLNNSITYFHKTNKDSSTALQSSISELSKEMKLIRDLLKEQQETNTLLKTLIRLIDNTKKKSSS